MEDELFIRPAAFLVTLCRPGLIASGALKLIIRSGLSRGGRAGSSPRGRRSARGLSAALVALLASSSANADPAAIDRIEPSERGSRFFVADSLDLATAGSMQLATGVVTTYANRLRTFGSKTEGEESRLVEHAIVLHPGASLVLAPGARFALDMPVAFQLGQPATLARVRYYEPASPALGDLRAGIDVRFLGPRAPGAGGLTLATGVNAWLPTGSRDDYTSDGDVRVGIHLGSALEAGWLLATMRVGYMYRRELPPFGSVSLGSEANGQAAVGWQTRHVVVGPELHASTILRDFFVRKSTPVEALLGAHVTAGDARIGLGGGASVVSGFGAAHLRGFASLEWIPGASASASDRDGDGVPDGEDVCPDVAGSRGGSGCPEPPRDADRDGVVDGEDACPDLPGVATSIAMTHGCPDADADGIPDPIDACPKTAGVASPIPRFHGCPPDADGDDVPDAEDACVDVAGVRTSDPKTNGCPPPPKDRDKDGVDDDDDACPDVPGPKSTDVASSGCPLVRREGSGLLVAGGVAIDGEPGLGPLATWLAEHVEVTKATIVVHDAKGVAQKRADAVVGKLVALGVAKKRLAARGVADRAASIEIVVAP
jgi:hypothetical protein